MKPKLLVTAVLGAALALPGVPAAAQTIGRHFHHGRLPDRFTQMHQVNRARFDGTAVGWGYDLQSSYDDRDWAPNTGNDWWNSRPDRAYPRWVQEQRGQACAPERMWWSGTGWHC